MFLGCWTDYELPGPKLQLLSLMCIVPGVARWRGSAFAPSTGTLFRVRQAVGPVGEELRLRVTTSAHFPVRASSGAVDSASTTAPRRLKELSMFGAATPEPFAFSSSALFDNREQPELAWRFRHRPTQER